MKTIKEVIAVLDDLIDCHHAYWRTAPSSYDANTIACLRRAKQIVKASKKCGCAPRKGK